MIPNYDLASDDDDMLYDEFLVNGYPGIGFMENGPSDARSENSVTYSPIVLNETEAEINVTEIL